MVVKDVDLAADIVIGILLQIMRGIIERGAPHDLIREALDAVLRALGAAETGLDRLDDVLDGQPGEGATP
jgi:hypothetical protein